MDDVTLHQCVRLGKFDTDRTVSFVPPDGPFELMSYRATQNINQPFKIVANVKEIGRTRLEVDVTVISTYPSSLAGRKVAIVIPTPKSTAVCKIDIKGRGKAKYDSDAGGILWAIKKFPGGCEYVLRANVELIASVNLDEKKWSRPPITMDFEVPMFTSSGLHIRYLTVSEKGYSEVFKWVKYVTKGGSYQFRI